MKDLLKRTMLVSILLICTCLFCIGQKRHCKLPRVAIKKKSGIQNIQFTSVPRIEGSEEVVENIGSYLPPEMQVSEEIIFTKDKELGSVQKTNRMKQKKKVTILQEKPSYISGVKSINKIHGLADSEEKVKLAAYILWGVAGCLAIAAIFCLIFTVNAVAPLLALAALFAIIGVICFVLAPHSGPRKTEIKF